MKKASQRRTRHLSVSKEESSVIKAVSLALPLILEDFPGGCIESEIYKCAVCHAAGMDDQFIITLKDKGAQPRLFLQRRIISAGISGKAFPCAVVRLRKKQ